MNTFYNNEAEIQVVVRGFESCETGKDEFKHRDHLTVALWYLSVTSLEEAIDRMRAGLLRFLDHHGVHRKKYNETLTKFWIEMVWRTLNEIEPQVPLVEKCNRVIEALQDPGLAFEYYSEELVWSDDARQRWVEPDLKPWRKF
jgi:N-formylglutamate deformylase